MSRLQPRRSSKHSNKGDNECRNGRKRNNHSKTKSSGGKLPQHAKSSLYKTELCRQFSISASCSYGSRCQFAHGEKDLRRRTCRHPKYKTQKCKAYWNQGFCPYGSRCMFLHDEDDKEQSDNNNNTIVSLTDGMKRLNVFEEKGMTSSENFGNRPRSASNRTLSIGSLDEVCKSGDATTVLPPLGNYVTRKGSFGGESSTSASSSHSYTSSTRRFSSFDLYDSVTPKTVDSGVTFNKDALKRWPSESSSIISSSSPLDDPLLATTSTTTSTVSTDSNAIDDSGSRLPFFKRLREKTSPFKAGELNQATKDEGTRSNAES